MRVRTRAQREALLALYRRKALGMSFRQFRRASWYDGINDCVMVPWLSMLIGIETDGYTHS